MIECTAINEVSTLFCDEGIFRSIVSFQYINGL